MKIATLKKHAEQHNARLVYSRLYDQYFSHDPAYTAGIRASKMFDKAALEAMSAEQFYTEVVAPLFPAPVVVEEVETIIAQPVADEWTPEEDADAWTARDAALIAVAKDRGATLSLVERIAPRVSLEKAPAPVGVCILADVPQETNADVMARAVAYVRDIRLTREYLAAHDDTGPEWEFFGYATRDGATWSVWRYADASGLVYQVTQSEDAPTGDGGYRELLGVLKLRHLSMCDGFPGSLVACEMKRALAAEQARADAARNLSQGGA